MFTIKSFANSSNQEYRRILIYADSCFINSEKKIVFKLNKKEEIFNGDIWEELTTAFVKHFMTIEVTNYKNVFVSDGEYPNYDLIVNEIVTSIPDPNLYGAGYTIYNSTDLKVYILNETESTDADGNTVITKSFDLIDTATFDNRTAFKFGTTTYRFNTTDQTFVEEQVIGEYDYLMSYDCNKIGCTALTDLVYPNIANSIDSYLVSKYGNDIISTLGI